MQNCLTKNKQTKQTAGFDVYVSDPCMCIYQLVGHVRQLQRILDYSHLGVSIVKVCNLYIFP